MEFKVKSQVKTEVEKKTKPEVETKIEAEVETEVDAICNVIFDLRKFCAVWGVTSGLPKC